MNKHEIITSQFVQNKLCFYAIKSFFIKGVIFEKLFSGGYPLYYLFKV